MNNEVVQELRKSFYGGLFKTFSFVVSEMFVLIGALYYDILLVISL